MQVETTLFIIDYVCVRCFLNIYTAGLRRIIDVTCVQKRTLTLSQFADYVFIYLFIHSLRSPLATVTTVPTLPT